MTAPCTLHTNACHLLTPHISTSSAQCIQEQMPHNRIQNSCAYTYCPSCLLSSILCQHWFAAVPLRACSVRRSLMLDIDCTWPVHATLPNAYLRSNARSSYCFLSRLVHITCTAAYACRRNNEKKRTNSTAYTNVSIDQKRATHMSRCNVFRKHGTSVRYLLPPHIMRGLKCVLSHSLRLHSVFSMH